MKDYYKTLQVPPTATEAEIKKSFRRLAFQYHPDKTPDSLLNEDIFKEIQEAYKVLVHKTSRENYLYKRRYHRSVGKIFTDIPLTPEAILLVCKKCCLYTETSNPYQIDYEALSNHMQELLSDQTIQILAQFNSPKANHEIIETLLKSGSSLPYSYSRLLANRLLQIPNLEASSKQQIHFFLQQQHQKEWWKKSQIGVVSLLTLLLCLLVFWMAKY